MIVRYKFVSSIAINVNHEMLIVAKIGINIRGREWTNPQGEVKYFNSITGWRIEKVSGENTNTEAPQPNTFEKPAPITNDNPFGDEQDDLPF